VVQKRFTRDRSDLSKSQLWPRPQKDEPRNGYDKVAPPRTEHLYGAFLADQFRKPNAVVLVAEIGGEVVGYTYASVEGSDYMALRGPAGLFHDLVVDPGHRGNGIGRMLLDATLAALKARGAPRVVLLTAERNAGAQRLFARAGFRRTMIEMTHEWDDVAS
jgi:ribosomal protein S18 acetylase RimI-like enzyme